MTKSERLLKDGTIAQGVAPLAGNGSLAIPVPVFQQELVGNANQYYPDKLRLFSFGKKKLLGDVLSDLWQGPTALYSFPPTTMQMKVVSTSAGDTAAGIGIRQVHIDYLDANYKLKTTSVTLNGLTPVLTVPTDILRINAFHSMSTGSNVVGVGDVTLTAAGNGTVYSLIAAGDNTARQAIYTIPDGMWGYISHWQASSGSTGNHFCQTILAATTHNMEYYPGTFLLQDEHGTQNGGVSITFPIPLPMPPKTDIRLAAIGDAVNANITALGAIMGWLEPVI